MQSKAPVQTKDSANTVNAAVLLLERVTEVTL